MLARDLHRAAQGRDRAVRQTYRGNRAVRQTYREVDRSHLSPLPWRPHFPLPRVAGRWSHKPACETNNAAGFPLKLLLLASIGEVLAVTTVLVRATGSDFTVEHHMLKSWRRITSTYLSLRCGRRPSRAGYPHLGHAQEVEPPLAGVMEQKPRPGVRFLLVVMMSRPVERRVAFRQFNDDLGHFWGTGSDTEGRHDGERRRGNDLSAVENISFPTRGRTILWLHGRDRIGGHAAKILEPSSRADGSVSVPYTRLGPISDAPSWGDDDLTGPVPARAASGEANTFSSKLLDHAGGTSPVSTGRTTVVMMPSTLDGAQLR